MIKKAQKGTNIFRTRFQKSRKCYILHNMMGQGTSQSNVKIKQFGTFCFVFPPSLQVRLYKKLLQVHSSFIENKEKRNRICFQRKLIFQKREKTEPRAILLKTLGDRNIGFFLFFFMRLKQTKPFRSPKNY